MSSIRSGTAGAPSGGHIAEAAAYKLPATTAVDEKHLLPDDFPDKPPAPTPEDARNYPDMAHSISGKDIETLKAAIGRSNMFNTGEINDTKLIAWLGALSNNWFSNGFTDDIAWLLLVGEILMHEDSSYDAFLMLEDSSSDDECSDDETDEKATANKGDVYRLTCVATIFVVALHRKYVHCVDAQRWSWKHEYPCTNFHMEFTSGLVRRGLLLKTNGERLSWEAFWSHKELISDFVQETFQSLLGYKLCFTNKSRCAYYKFFGVFAHMVDRVRVHVLDKQDQIQCELDHHRLIRLELRLGSLPLAWPQWKTLFWDVKADNFGRGKNSKGVVVDGMVRLFKRGQLSAAFCFLGESICLQQQYMAVNAPLPRFRLHGRSDKFGEGFYLELPCTSVWGDVESRPEVARYMDSEEAAQVLFPSFFSSANEDLECNKIQVISDCNGVQDIMTKALKAAKSKVDESFGL